MARLLALLAIVALVSLACGGEVFITKMPVVKIEDLAAAMIAELAPLYDIDPTAIDITTIGTKPGEKLYEELMNQEETRRAVELPNYFSVLPAFRGIYQDIKYDYPALKNEKVNNPYISSEQAYLPVDAIRMMLNSNGLLEVPAERTAERYWPGDKEEKR